MQKSALTNFFNDAIGATLGVGFVELANIPISHIHAPAEILVYQAVGCGMVAALVSACLHSSMNLTPTLASRIFAVSIVAVLAICLAVYVGSFNGWSLPAVAAIIASIAVVGGSMNLVARLLGQ